MRSGLILWIIATLLYSTSVYGQTPPVVGAPAAPGVDEQTPSRPPNGPRERPNRGRRIVAPPVVAPPVVAPPVVAPPVVAPPVVAPPVVAPPVVAPAQCVASSPNRADGVQRIAAALHENANRSTAGDDWSTAGEHQGFYVITIGSDGLPVEPVPQHIPEDKRVVVVFYHPGAPGYRVDIAGCQPVPIRVQGSVAAAIAGRPGAAAPAGVADVTLIGRCSASSAVTITTTFPADAAAGCAAGTHATTFQTDPIYRFSVSLGAMVSYGDVHDVGVTPGVGGQPGQVFDRRSRWDYQVGAVILFYPWGMNPNETTPRTFYRRIGIGTAIPLSDPLVSINVLLGYAVVPGLELTLGVQFLRRVRVIDGGLVNGSVFNDDSSALPTHTEWRGVPGFVMGISAGSELIKSIFGR